MAPIGLSKIKDAKRSGHWDVPDRPDISLDPPEDFKKALNRNRKAAEFFQKLAPTYQKQFIGWIRIAKRQETREKRIRESIQLLEKREKLGLR